MNKKEISLITIKEIRDTDILIEVNKTLKKATMDFLSCPLKIGDTFLGLVQYTDNKTIIKKIKNISHADNVSVNIIL